MLLRGEKNRRAFLVVVLYWVVLFLCLLLCGIEVSPLLLLIDDAMDLSILIFSCVEILPPKSMTDRLSRFNSRLLIQKVGISKLVTKHD